MKVQGQEIEFFMLLCFHVSTSSLFLTSIHNFSFFYFFVSIPPMRDCFVTTSREEKKLAVIIGELRFDWMSF